MHQEDDTAGDIAQTPKTHFALWSSQVTDSRQWWDALISHSRHLPPLPLSWAPHYFTGTRVQQWTVVLLHGSLQWVKLLSPRLGLLHQGRVLLWALDLQQLPGLMLGVVKGYSWGRLKSIQGTVVSTVSSDCIALSYTVQVFGIL